MFATFAALPDNRPIDVEVDFGAFTTTVVRFTAVTLAGRDFMAAQFGDGAFEATVRKSFAPAFAEAAAQAGLKVA